MEININKVKVFLLSLCLFLCLTFSGCMVVKYKFMEDVSEISNIEIVKLIGLKQEENIVVAPVLETVHKITDKEAFLEDFDKLSCRLRWTEPTGIDSEYIGRLILKIEYLDGKYELISDNAQAEYGNALMGNLEYNMHTGMYVFNEQEFNELLEKYMQ